MPNVPFTQYLRPDGRRTATTIDMPQDIADLAQEFIAAGGSYTSELLPGDDVSLCAEFEVEGERRDIVCVVCFNNSSVPDSVEELVRESVDYLHKARAA
jgi:hypothetical protein